MFLLEAYPPAGVVFTSIGVLLSVSTCIVPFSRDVLTSWAAKSIGASRGPVLDLFTRIENIFRGLETHIEGIPTARMTDTIVGVLVEVLCVLAIATKEAKQSRASE
jgi:hypothetical protein